MEKNNNAQDNSRQIKVIADYRQAYQAKHYDEREIDNAFRRYTYRLKRYLHLKDIGAPQVILDNELRMIKDKAEVFGNRVGIYGFRMFFEVYKPFRKHEEKYFQWLDSSICPLFNVDGVRPRSIWLFIVRLSLNTAKLSFGKEKNNLVVVLSIADEVGKVKSELISIKWTMRINN